MKSISLYFLLIVAVLSSCQKQNINMHTVIHSDGTCERTVSYSNVMTKEQRDSLLGEHLNGWSQPMPECLNIDAFCKSYTEVGKDDTVKTTFTCPFSSVEEMCQQTPLQLNGVRLKSSAKLHKRFRWFYTEYTFTETFACVGDSFKLPPVNYADENIVSYWFTGHPNITEGLSGAETMSKLNEIEPLINKWLDDNFVNLCFDYIVSHYDSIPNPPVSRQRFIELEDSLVKFAKKGKDDILGIQADKVFKDFFGSDSYALFFDEDTNCGKELMKIYSDRLSILGFSVPYSLSMPGTVIDAGTGICKDGVVYYPLTGERLIPHDYVISAKSRITNIWAYIVTLLVILIAIGSFAYGKKLILKKDLNETKMDKKTISTCLRGHVIPVLALVAMAGQAQTFTPVVEDSIDFVITGTTNSSYDSVAMFPCAPHGETVKFPIVDGKFKVTGRQPRHTFIQIGDYAENDLRFIVEEMPTNINLVTGEVSGSKLQQRFIRCQMREREIHRVVQPWWNSLSDEDKERIITMRMDGLSDATAKDSANMEKYDSHMADLLATNRQNIRENLDNVIPAWYLYTGMGSLTLEQMNEFMRENAAYAHHPAMERPWKKYWGILQQMNITGKPAPDFEAEAPDGAMHRLSEYTGHGQYVLIDFWASWCGPCIGSFPLMKEIYATYKGRGLVFLGVSCDKNRDAWLKALEKHQLPWTALLSPARKGDACELYGITGIPAVILIAPDGKVVSTDLEGEKLKAKLADIFGQ